MVDHARGGPGALPGAAVLSVAAALADPRRPARIRARAPRDGSARLSSGRRPAQAVRAGGPSRSSVRSVSSLPAGLDSGMGARGHPALAGAAVASAGRRRRRRWYRRRRRSRRTRPLGCRHRHLPQRAQGGSAATHPPPGTPRRRSRSRSGFRLRFRPWLRLGRRTSRLAAAGKLLRGACPLALLPSDAVRSRAEIELHLFMLNPCREYWGDIHSRHEAGRRTGGADPGARYLTEGNELLAAWGRAGRDTTGGTRYVRCVRRDRERGIRRAFRAAAGRPPVGRRTA